MNDSQIENADLTKQKVTRMTQFFTGNAFKVNISDTLAIVDFDLDGEKVNKWDDKSLNELDQVLSKLEANKGSLSAVLFRSAKPKSFIVGADINVIQKITTKALAEEAGEMGQRVFSRVEDFPLPTIAAIEGPSMGGGTEFLLSCDYRVASDSSKTIIGLPEVKLGIIPGWGGNFRMTRLVELPTALDLILSGKALNAKKALRAGLVDEVYPEGLFVNKAMEYARTRKFKRGVITPKYSTPINKYLSNNFIGRSIVFKKTRETLEKTTRGHYPAPVKALELIEKSWGKSRAEWMKLEKEFFSELAITEISKNLIRIFFMTEAVKRESGSSLSSEEAAKVAPIKQMAVLGAGVMGAGIAYQSAAKGLWVFLKDVSYSAVGKGIQHAKKLFDKSVSRKKLTKIQAEDKLRHLRPQTDYSGFKGLDLVIEAIVEDLAVKKKVFAELESVVGENCILASNTSSLELSAISADFKNKARFVGLHFFNPVDKMPLVEVVVTDATPPENTTRAVNYVKSIGKTPLVTKDGPGFLVNRLLVPFLLEAGYIMEEGADLEKVDKEIKKFGMPMGPYELLDEIGLDVVSKISPIFEKSLGERFKASESIYKVSGDSKQKRFGKKTGLGFYKWENGKRAGIDKDNLEALTGLSLSGQKFLVSGEALANRMIYPMINEAAVVLEEKIVASAEKVDLGMIFGIGFPPFRGGLCRYADSIGLEKIIKELERMSATHGPRFKPTEALKRAAANGGTFYK
ncbi:MAG: 3-hydroxyacyl-CoA dehydrogenase NAD-binding domain-containing protein [Bdellovibrionota bacterium]